MTRHGTVGGYSGGCRCSRCRQAMADYRRARRRAGLDGGRGSRTTAGGAARPLGVDHGRRAAPTTTTATLGGVPAGSRTAVGRQPPRTPATSTTSRPGGGQRRPEATPTSSPTRPPGAARDPGRGTAATSPPTAPRTLPRPPGDPRPRTATAGRWAPPTAPTRTRWATFGAGPKPRAGTPSSTAAPTPGLRLPGVGVGSLAAGHPALHPDPRFTASRWVADPLPAGTIPDADTIRRQAARLAAGTPPAPAGPFGGQGGTVRTRALWRRLRPH